MKRKHVIGVAVAATGLWAFFAALPFLAWGWDIEWHASTMGQWGDTFGALNALASTTAFSAVLYTIWMQQTQISDAQRDVHVQRFESSFFQLLDLMRSLRANILFTPRSGPGTQLQGLEAMREFTRMLEARLVPDVIYDSLTSDLARDRLIETYMHEILPRGQNGLGPYFRVIYNMLDRIRTDTKLTTEEKVGYANLLRGQLNDDEICLMGVNGLTKISKDFSALIGDYRMLKYAPQGSLRTVLEHCYPASTFAPRS